MSEHFAFMNCKSSKDRFEERIRPLFRFRDITILFYQISLIVLQSLFNQLYLLINKYTKHDLRIIRCQSQRLSTSLSMFKHCT